MTSHRVKLERQPDAPDLGVHMRHAARTGWPLVQKGCHAGQNALIVSTGATLMDKTVLAEIKRLHKEGAVVFGLKESIPYLRRHGVKVTYSVSMDPSGDRQVSRTPADPNVIYCLASSCHPKLYDYLARKKCHIQVFHSANGWMDTDYKPGILMQAGPEPVLEHMAVTEGEFELYTMAGYPFCPVIAAQKSEVELYVELWGPGQAVMGEGFTVTNRALSLTKYMGFDHTTIAGADFGWREEGGSHYCKLVKVKPQNPHWLVDHGLVDGKNWYTFPDQLASAADLAVKIQRGEVSVIGDSLAQALSKRTPAFIRDLVRFE